MSNLPDPLAPEEWAPEPSRIISVCKLPDGRYAVRNERDVSDLTAEDEAQMANALILWFDLRKRSRPAREAER